MLLRILLIEVSEERGVSQVLKTGGIVGHHVLLAREVGDQRAVAVSPLVGACETTEVGGGPVGRHGSFRKAGYGRRVVREGFDGPMPDVVAVSDQG